VSEDAGATSGGKTALIGIDWGTSSLRAYRIDRVGEVIEERSSDNGILAVDDGAFEQALIDIAGDWMSEAACPVVLSGMITSRQGWVELPYISCPAGQGEFSSAIHPHRLSSGQQVHFITGLKVTGSDGVPDVMRGEETQLIGALGIDDAPRLFVLPGTHSKWAATEAGKVVKFATFMTGELFSILSHHSILGRLMVGDEHDDAAYTQGVTYGRKTDASAGGLLKRLFGSRALGLFGHVPGTGAASHLSGLLIGCEIREALDCLGAGTVTGPVTILGEPDLVDLYVTALDQFDVPTARGPRTAAALGHFTVARAAGLLSAAQ